MDQGAYDRRKNTACIYGGPRRQIERLLGLEQLEDLSFGFFKCFPHPLEVVPHAIIVGIRRGPSSAKSRVVTVNASKPITTSAGTTTDGPISITGRVAATELTRTSGSDVLL